MNQTVVIHDDGSGTLALHAEVTPLLRDYLASLAEVSGDSGLMKDGNVFDAASIRKDYESRPGITVVDAAAPTRSSLDLTLGFDSLQDLFRGQDALKSAGVLSYVESADHGTIRFHLDRANYGQLAALFPLLRSPVFSELGPQANGAVSSEDYLSMIRFSMGEAAPAQLKKSFVTLTIQPDGEILSQSGGTVIGDTVVFRIPLLRLLVLESPLDYSITITTREAANRG